MMDVEITEMPPLSSEQHALVHGHSLWNGYNVLRRELGELGQRLASDPALLSTGITACDHRIARLCDRAQTLADAAQLDELEITIDAEIDKHRQRRPRLAELPGAVRVQECIQAVAWILRVRARELLARAATPREAVNWTAIPSSELEADFHEFLTVTSQVSHGRFRFVENLARQEPAELCIEMKFEPARGQSIHMPPVFKDVMRDLLANARKYTPAGGQIRAAAHSASDGLRFVVQDTGRGIPAAEILDVVQPGRRGSNVQDIRTMGGGYGLTKAFLVTRQFRGRFWIQSEEHRGTKIRVWLPPPGTGAPFRRGVD